MKHYLDPNTQMIYAYESDGSQDDLIPSHFVAVTDEQAQAHNAAKVQAAFDALSYAEKRRAEYPSLGDQLDALFHAGVFPSEMAARIQAVKDKYPKG